jgi:monoamine oxidase
MDPDKPVVIIGAGISGLAAAARLSKHGIAVTVLEARDRIGGRIFTLRDPVLDAPIELGAEFIHGLPPEIWERLREADIAEVTGQIWCFRDRQLLPCHFFSQVDSILDQMDDSLPDESFLAFLERKFPDQEDDLKLREAKKRAIGYVSGFNAADPALVGVHWLANEARAEEKIEGYRAFRSKNGYADLLEAFEQQLRSRDVAVRTKTLVQKVVWNPGAAQVIAYHENTPCTFTASQVLITLPLPLLKDSQGIGAVEFVPPLSQQKTEALQRLEMGKVIRIVLRFRHRFWDSLPTGKENMSGMSFLLSDDEFFPTWWTTMPRKYPIITGWAPFRSGERLSGRDKDAVVNQALQTLSSIFGVKLPQLKEWLEAAYLHDWQADPFSRGAYSYAKVGADGAQEALAAPLESTLFFAGEATDTSGNNGTVHGAISSGYRAAEEIIKVLAR